MDPKSLPGGPAFPISIPGCGDNGAHGMSLRDKFAEAALISGEASNWRDNQYKPVSGLTTIENTARHAYLIADAMLKARGSAQ